MLYTVNYNVIFLLVISIISFIIDRLSNGKYYKYLNKINKISKQWKILFVFIVFYMPKLYYQMTKKDEENLVTIYEPFNKKRKVSATKKKLVAANQKWHCNICNKLLDASYEIDHKQPLYKGGGNEVTNLQALCRNCHGNKTIRDRLL